MLSKLEKQLDGNLTNKKTRCYVTVLPSFIFGNAYLKVQIHFAVLEYMYMRSLLQTYILYIKLQKKDIQYLRSKNTYLNTLYFPDHSHCSMYILTPVIMV